LQINLPVRFYRAVPTSNPDGLVTEDWTLDVAKTAFVELHCWNIGCPTGIPVPEQYWVFEGSPQNHVYMWRAVTEEIAPSLQAARGVGMPVVHVQGENIAVRYVHLQPPMPPAQVSPPCREPISDHLARRANRVHGEGYNQWSEWRNVDIAEPVKPIDGETVIVTTAQFDDWLRSRGIDTLLYTGFSTNLCILDSPAAIKAMASLGYRCVILREATTGVEFPETLETRSHTQNAIRYIEAWWGYSASASDFRQACAANRS
jgi:nicotinamidase-related amidase